MTTNLNSPQDWLWKVKLPEILTPDQLAALKADYDAYARRYAAQNRRKIQERDLENMERLYRQTGEAIYKKKADDIRRRMDKTDEE